MSVSIYIRETNGMWVSGLTPIALSLDIRDAVAFPNLIAAQEAHTGFRMFTAGMTMQCVAYDPETLGSPMNVLCELDDLEEIQTTPAMQFVLVASLKKSSKYFRQFDGWQKVTNITSPRFADHYCFRVAHNAYRHEDLIFAVKLPGGEVMRLDRFTAPARKRQAA